MAKKKTAINSVAMDCVGLDLGAAFANVVSLGVGAVRFRNIQAPINMSWRRLKEYPPQSVIKLDDSWWMFGEECAKYAPDAVQEYRSMDRYTSPWYRRQMAYALSRAFRNRIGEGVICPYICLTIPAELFKIGREKEVISNIVGEYTIGYTDETALHVVVERKKILILPEGGAAMMMMTLRPGLDNKRYTKGSWVVVDQGWLTVDMCKFVDGNYVPASAISDDQAGISAIAAEVQAAVYKEAGIKLQLHEIDSQMLCDEIAGVDIKVVRDGARCQVAERIVRTIEQTYGGKPISGILMVGGQIEQTMKQLRSVKARMPDMTLANDPGDANAWGAYYYCVDAAKAERGIKDEPGE